MTQNLAWHLQLRLNSHNHILLFSFYYVLRQCAGCYCVVGEIKYCIICVCSSFLLYQIKQFLLKARNIFFNLTEWLFLDVKKIYRLFFCASRIGTFWAAVIKRNWVLLKSKANWQSKWQCLKRRKLLHSEMHRTKWHVVTYWKMSSRHIFNHLAGNLWPLLWVLAGKQMLKPTTVLCGKLHCAVWLIC